MVLEGHCRRRVSETDRACALLASRKRSIRVSMGEIPCANARIDVNTNRNPKKKPKQFHHSSGNGFVGRYQSNYVDSPTVTQAVSDDAHSFNQTSTSGGAFNCGRYFTFNVATYSKSELLSLRKRLSAELDQIRDLQDRIGIARNSKSRSKSKILSLKKNFGFGIGFVEGYNGLYDESGGINNGMTNTIDCRDLLRECKQVVKKLLRHKYGWLFKSPVDAVALGLYDYHQIVKRPMDLGTVKANLDKNLYPSPLEFASDVRLAFNNALLYNPKTNPVYGFAEQILKDFEGFFAPMQRKIDELFVDQHRGKEFQERRFLSENRHRKARQFQGSSRNNVNEDLVAGVVKNEKSSASPDLFPCDFKKHNRMARPTEAHSSASTSSNPPTTQSDHLPIPGKTATVASPCLPVKETTAGSVAGTVKLPKSKSNDRRKREMSLEEKQNLVIGLQGVPQEKMPYLVHILRKRNEHLAQDGDEIELDIEAMDTETLWELDSLVTDLKMIASKVECQDASMLDIDPSGIAPTTPVAESVTGVMDDENDRVDQMLKENEEENVDIDDDMPATSFPQVEIEKDDVGEDESGDGPDRDHDGKDASRSSSSSDSSSSSSDSSSSSSDSDLGSDSDADGVNS